MPRGTPAMMQCGVRARLAWSDLTMPASREAGSLVINALDNAQGLRAVRRTFVAPHPARLEQSR